MKVIVDNLSTEYEESGNGRAVLLLHGWKDSLTTFDPLISSLGDGYHIVRLDLPGLGKTEMPRSNWNLDNYIDFVVDFINKKNLSLYAIAGHSFGGRIVIKGVADHRLKAEKIILIGAAGVAKRKTFRNYFFVFLAKLGKMITYIPPFHFYRNELKKKLYGVVGSDYFKSGKLKKTFLQVIREDLTEYAKKIQVPSLLIWGANDTETPLTDGQRLSSYIPHAHLEVIPGTGHFVHKEASQKVAELIKKFLC